jgi:hypothetical protein
LGMAINLYCCWSLGNGRNDNGLNLGSFMSQRTFISETEVDKALDYLRDNADAAAKARAERIYVEEYRKTVKAQIMKEHDTLPFAGQEREAYADGRYVQHLEAIREAVHADEKHRFLLGAAQAKIEAWRSQCANERAAKV